MDGEFMSMKSGVWFDLVENFGFFFAMHHAFSILNSHSQF